MRVLLHVIDLALAIYTGLLLAALLLYWLIEFGALDTSRRAVAVIRGWLFAIAAPVLRPLRAVLPDFGGIDVSPVVAILAIMMVRYLIALYVLPKLPS
jgi:YggT family protein